MKYKLKKPVMTYARYFLLVLICVSLVLQMAAQTSGQNSADENYAIDISANHLPLISGHLKLGANRNPAGDILDANSLYFTKNGKPWYPVMGEFHFSRFPKEQWESSILKMKMAGIDIIATYVFWIYHEEEEGKWDWSGNRDLRYFAELCARHQVYLFMRIGPWCHGEVRNGGFPDWLLRKPFKTRTNDSAYIGYVKKLFNQVNLQLKGQYFKDGGPVIGTQLENEFRFNNSRGLEHILNLKKIAVATGMDVPYYTATGWPGSDIKQNELIPVWGGYPEAPWDKRTVQLPLSENYLFAPLRSDPTIGNDLLGTIQDTTNYNGYRYPYATAEMGAGIQITYHRRPIIQPVDVSSLAYIKTGSGANLMGYYMFHGGSNPVGKLSTLQESKATKYPNDYPVINYDFQSPIDEWGQLRPSYRAFKLLHYFLNDFGEELVQQHAFFPAKKPTGPSDNQALRWNVRADDNEGYIFINNFQRQLDMHAINDVQFSIKMKEDRVLKVPQLPVSISANATMIWPFNLKLETATLLYSTTQPVCKLPGSNTTHFVFFAHSGIRAEYVFADKNIQSLTASNATVSKKDKKYFVIISQPGTSCFIQIKLAGGKSIQVLTLTHQQALDSWKVTLHKKQYLCISDGELTVKDNSIRLQSTGRAVARLDIYPAIQKLNADKNCSVTKKTGANFTSCMLRFKEKQPIVKWQQNKAPAPAAFTDESAGLPLYKTTLQAVPTATYWKVKIPATLMQCLSGAFLNIEYEGDTQAAYLDGRLIADDFYAGSPMTIGLHQFSAIAGKELTLLVTPLSDSSKIYFEKGIREQLAGKNAAVIKSIIIVPQYETIIKIF